MISVIVADYNGGEVTQNCINSIRVSTYCEYELIVIDTYTNKQSYSQGLNEGIKKAKGDILVCANNDIIVKQDCLTYIAETMQDKKIGIANPMVLDMNSNICKQVDYANGACMVIRREALNKVGLFDEKFKIYFDDVDLSFRIRKAGYKIAVIEKAIIWHIGGSTTSKRSYFTNKRKHIHDIMRFMYKKIKGEYKW